MESDLVDQLIADWAREVPDLDTNAMRVVGRVLRLGRKFETRINEILKPHGLRYTDFDVLATLRRSGRPYCLAPKELLKSVVITSGGMTAALDRLTDADLIERVPNSDDRRSMSAKLTAQGARLVEELIVVRFHDASRSIDALSPAERVTLGKLLRKLTMAQREV